MKSISSSLSDLNKRDMDQSQTYKLLSMSNEKEYSKNVNFLCHLCEMIGMKELVTSQASQIMQQENIIDNLTLQLDLQVLPNERNEKEEDEDAMILKCKKLARLTVLDNWQLRVEKEELMDANFDLREEMYELQDNINRQV